VVPLTQLINCIFWNFVAYLNMYKRSVLYVIRMTLNRPCTLDLVPRFSIVPQKRAALAKSLRPDLQEPPRIVVDRPLHGASKECGKAL
jgi:hypothetical protein